jgi:hypothetical protein
MGWCAQALKAAKMAHLDCHGLEEAIKKAIPGFKKNFQGDYNAGGFGYTGPQVGGLTPVGVLCMQLLGAGKDDGAMGGLATMNNASWMAYDLDNPSQGAASLYFWYYGTQAKFHAGGDTWNKWNKIFSPELVKKQHKISKEQSGYVDHKGRPQEIGFWDQYKGAGSNEGPVFATLLACLQLEVYYRYLPTFKTVKEEPVDATPQQNTKKKTDETGIDVNLN